MSDFNDATLQERLAITAMTAFMLFPLLDHEWMAEASEDECKEYLVIESKRIASRMLEQIEHGEV